jgi:hypothetical protein
MHAILQIIKILKKPAMVQATHSVITSNHIIFFCFSTLVSCICLSPQKSCRLQRNDAQYNTAQTQALK